MQTSNSNVDSPQVSATIGGEPKHLGAAMREDSGLEIVTNRVSSRQRQLAEANIVQSNTLHGGFPSPIQRLPTEILSEIFVYCLPEDALLSPTPRLAPVLLTSICRRWREVAIGLPSLWRKLQLVGDDDWQRRAFFYESWLERSAGCPLSLALECYADLSEPRSFLQPYIQQISSLRLEFFICHGPFMMEDFHALKKLVINKYDFDRKRAIDRSLSKLPVNLHKLDIAGVLFNRRQLDFFTDSAWARLTHIDINIDGLDAFPRILHLCPAVSSVTMFGIFDPIQTPEPITHTNLQFLRMCGNALSIPARNLGLFKVLTLPKLRLIEARHMGAWPHEEFKEFLTRSKCPLESLTFGSTVWATDQQQAEYATLMPSLRFVVESDSHFDIDAFLEDV